MAEEIVRIIKVDTKNSGKSIKDLRNEIKSLRQELEKTEVGSKEFESTLKQLTQTQKSYNEVQQQIRDLSRTNQQDMVKFASFARNLGKSYSALNAAIGLFADKNEDVQKAMLKVQRTIQLIQGLDGITGLIRDIPKVVAGFKSWIQALNPLEKQIDRIAKGINGIDPAKARAMNEANRGGGTTTTATAGGNVQQINIETEALQDQTQTIVPLNEQWERYTQELAEAKKAAAEYQPEMSRLTDIFEEYNKHTTEAKVNMTEYNNAVKELLSGNPETLHNFLENVTLDVDALEATAKKFGWTNEQLIEGLKNLEEGLGEDTQYVKGLEKAIVELEGSTGKAATGIKRLGAVMKSVASTVMWTLVITAIIGAIYKLWDYIKNLKTAAQEQREFNKAVNELTNQSASKAVVVLKELAIGYQKLGDSAAAKQKFIEQYADKIKETGISIDTVKKAEDVFVNNTDKYIEAIMKRAKAQAIENKAIELYQQYLDDAYDREQKGEKLTFWQKLASGQLVGQPEMYSQATQSYLEKNRAKAKKDLDQMEKDMDERLRKMFEDIAELEKDYSGFFTTVASSAGKSTTDWAAEYKEALDALRGYVDDYLDIFKDARTKELDDNRKTYEENVKNINLNFLKGVEAAQGNAKKLLEVEEEKNKALKLAQLAYERQRLEIIDKYNDEVFEKQKAELDREYSLLEKQLERNRRLYDTTNLKEPKQANYQTTYNQNPLPLGLGRDWMSVYQSKEDVEKQYNDQVKYNNEFLKLTKDRINNENNLLNEEINVLTEKAKMLQEKLDSTDVNDVEKQREIVDQLIEIDETLFTNRQTIAENTIALDNAVTENEQANLDAYLEMQEKRKQALDGVLEVASTAAGALANIFRTEMNNDKLSQQQREKAMKAYKAFAITQAIADTWKGANEAYAAMASIPYVGPALGIAASAAAVIAGLANVRAIMSESMSSTSQTASVTAPAPMETAPIEYTRNLVGDKELDEINQPIRCYVLESDISKTQNKVKVTEMNATF